MGALLGGGYYIAPQDELVKADAIIVVSGGDTVSRTQEAVKVYQSKWAPVLIFAGAALDPDSPSNASAMREIAISEGIPPDVIALDESSLNTKQNANEVSHIIEALNFKRVILVTSPYHQRRAYLEFRERLGRTVTIINHPATDEAWSRSRWWLSSRGWYFTLIELPKTLLASIVQ